MGSKKVLPAYEVIKNGSMSGTSTIQSISPTFIENHDTVSIQLDWTGTADGTFSISISIDGINYHALTFAVPLPTPGGVAGGFTVQLGPVRAKYVNVSYTNSSGSGTLNVWIYAGDYN